MFFLFLYLSCTQPHMVISLDTLSFLVPAKKLEFIDNSYEVNIDIFLTDVNINVLEKIGSFLSKILKERLNPKLPPELTQLFNSVYDQSVYISAQVASRKKYYTGPPTVPNTPCLITATLLDSDLPSKVESTLLILSELTPTASATDNLAVLSNTIPTLLAGTLITTFNYLNSVIFAIDTEIDMLISLSTKSIPPFIHSLLSKSGCLLDSTPFSPLVTSVEYLNKGLFASFYVQQKLNAKTFYTAHYTPLGNYKLSFPNTELVFDDNQVIHQLSCSKPLENCTLFRSLDKCTNLLQEIPQTAPLSASSVFENCKFEHIPVSEPTATLTGLVLPITSYVLNNENVTHPSLTPQLALSKSRMEIKYLNKLYHFGPNANFNFKLLPFILSASETEKLISLIQAFYGPLWVPENKDYVFLSIVALILMILGGTWANLNKSLNCVKYIQPPNQNKNNKKRGRHPVILRVSKP